MVLLVLLLLIGFGQPSNALLTITLQAQDGDVLLTADGSLNLAAASKVAKPTDCGGAIEPGSGGSWAAVVGPPRSATVTCDIYSAEISGPVGFGTGAATFATSGGIVYTGIGSIDSMAILGVPDGYVSGTPLGGFSRFRNTSLAILGAEAGTYAWNWGSGVDRDSVVLQVIDEPPGVGIPTLSQLAGWLLMASLIGVGALTLLRQRGR